MITVLVLVTILAFLTMDFLLHQERPAATEPEPGEVGAGFRDLTALPGGLFISPWHTWANVEPDGSVLVGADALPGTLLGGIEEIAGPTPGARIRRGERLAVLSRGSRSIELAAPVDGEVALVNPETTTDPGLVADEPYLRGWLARMVPTHLGDDLRDLSIAEESRVWMRRELGRLRDLLAGFGNRGALAAATLPDGGPPVAGVAEHLDPADWRRLVEDLFTP